MAKVRVSGAAERAVLEQKGRLTTGDASVYERRRGLANPLEDCALLVETMINNWPAEYDLPPKHWLFNVIREMRTVSTELVTAPNTNDEDEFLDLI